MGYVLEYKGEVKRNYTKDILKLKEVYDPDDVGFPPLSDNQIALFCFLYRQGRYEIFLSHDLSILGCKKDDVKDLIKRGLFKKDKWSRIKACLPNYSKD